MCFVDVTVRPLASQIDGVNRIKGAYAHHASRQHFHRRTYHLTGTYVDHLHLVHYLDFQVSASQPLVGGLRLCSLWKTRRQHDIDEVAARASAGRSGFIQKNPVSHVSDPDDARTCLLACSDRETGFRGAFIPVILPRSGGDPVQRGMGAATP